MNQVQTLHEVTSELYDLVHITPSPDERGEVIEKINELLDQREQILNEIEGPYSDEEKRLGKEILQMNETIQIQVQSLMKHVKIDMANIKKQKTSNQKYTNPYQNLNNFDGMFLDKKK